VDGGRQLNNPFKSSRGAIRTRPRSRPGPSLSIVCVAYKRPQLLKVLIESLLAQTVQDFELLIMHDGPDPQISEILETYCLAHPGKIKSYFSEERYNDYGHTLRDIGIQLVSAPLLLLTNDDNYYVPTFVENMLNSIATNDLDIVYCDMVHSHVFLDLPNPIGYQFLSVEPRRLRIDVGCFIARTSLAQRVGFRDKGFEGDATYFEDLVALKPSPRTIDMIS
jgi:glycosyltransferase involved in cell wall biosynthesis